MKILVTGATGFIGSWTIPVLTAAGHHVIALVRRPEQADSLATLVAERGSPPGLLRCVTGDLGLPGLGLSTPIDPDAIIHLGASFGWNLDPDVARSTNVDGSLEVVRLAARHRAHLMLIGGYMLTNRVHLDELGIDLSRPSATDWSRVAGTTGVYEASKLESHARSVAEANRCGVSWQAVHPATLCGHSATGQLTSGQPLSEFIESVSTGRLPAVPGSTSHWLPLITVDHLASIIAAAISEDHADGREILAIDDATPSLGELVNLIAEAAGRRPIKARVPLGLLRATLAIPGLRRLVPTSRESLSFIRTERFDLAATRKFEQAAALERPDIRAAVATSVHAFRARSTATVPAA